MIPESPGQRGPARREEPDREAGGFDGQRAARSAADRTPGFPRL